MTNFDFLKNTLDFATFADVAISAENSKEPRKARNTKRH